jgi:Zn-dependent peptidase ImmA (M78 family)
MKLPGIIYLGHRKIKVKEIGARTASKDEIYGDFDVNKDLIRVDKTLTPEKKLNTLIHEIIHVLLDHFNAELKLKDEEKVCEVLGSGLSDLLSQNPKVIKVINSVYNNKKK